MKTYQTIRIGLGEVICDIATVGRYAAVTLEPSKEEPGTVGEPGPDLPLTELRPGSTVLEFHGKQGAEVLIEDIVKSLRKKGHNLSMFLRQLATSIEAGNQEIKPKPENVKCLCQHPRWLHERKATPSEFEECRAKGCGCTHYIAPESEAR